MQKYIIHLFSSAVIILLFVGHLRAEEDIDRFILPETPPTIERLKRPPLDQPVVRKQNFVSESDISLPPVPLGLTFYRLYSEEYPVSIGIYHGSFATLGGHFAFTSPRGFRVGYAADYSVGEKPNLSKEKNAFQYMMEKEIDSTLHVGGSVETVENTVWTLHKEYVSLRSNAAWYPSGNVNIAASASYAKGELKGQEANESWAGTCALTWQPRDGHNITASYAPRRDTALGAGADLSTLGLDYDFTLLSRLVVGAGYRLEDRTLFPQARAIWHVLAGLRLNVAYEPGIERPSWGDLYLAQDTFVRSSPGLALEKKTFRMRETASYYWDERGSIDLEFSQASVENYRYWQKEARSDYIVPVTISGKYVSMCRLGFRHRWGRFSPHLGLTYRSDGDLPLVPEYFLASGLGYAWRDWNFGAEYDFVSPRLVAQNDDRKLGACGDASLSAAKTITQGIDVFAAVENLFGQTIEIQPGFARSARNFKAGTTIRF